MSMSIRNRRQFLQVSGIAIANVIAGRNLFADIRKPDPLISGSQEVANSRKLLGLMVDAARLPESIEYYRRVIEFCADWGFNTLQFRLTDDQGSVLRFTSVPGLVTHRNAFTSDQLRGLVEYGRRYGIDLIPEVESFGHTGYITRSPQYAHLLDRKTEIASSFSGVIPVNPETLELLNKLYREVAAIFPSTYFHGGCDEVNWGGSTLSLKALQTKTRAQIWADYLNSLNQICEGLDKDLIVWGDYVLHKEPEILGLLNKKIIIMDWNYWDNNAAEFQESLLSVRANGSRGIGAPALAWSGWGPRAGTEQLRNIDAFAEAYLGVKDRSSLGVILTNWVPSNYIQNSIWDGWAYAAVAFTDGTATAQTSGFRQFVEKHYAADWNEIWSEIFQIIYAAAPSRRRAAASEAGLILPTPWSNDQELADVLRQASPVSNPFPRLRSLLVLTEPLVRKNLSDFQAFQLSVEYLERIFWRESVVAEQAAKKPLDKAASTLLIQSIAERDRVLAEVLARDWDNGRPSDSEAKSRPLVDLGPKYQLLFQWKQAAIYSAFLADHPDRFYQLLDAAKSA